MYKRQFTICSFWLVSALTEIGEVDRARALCEKLLSYATPLFPVSYTHLTLPTKA